MKRTIILSILAVAAMTTISCTKENTETPVSGKKAVLSIDASAFDAVTKVANYNDARNKFQWEAGDKLQLFSFTKSTNNTTTAWDYFETGTGGRKAVFSGTVPDEYLGTSVLAIHTPKGAQMLFGSNKWRAIFCIPQTQDGNGLHNSIIAGMPEYDASTNTFTLATADDVTGDVLSSRFKLWNALTYLTLPELEDGKKIVEIKVTCTEGGENFMACTNNSAKSFGLNLETLQLYNYNKSAMSCSLFINNGGILTGEVSFASRAIGKGKHLRFEFKNQEDKIARITFALGTGENGRGLMEGGFVGNLGEVPITAANFTYDSYAE